MNMMLVFFIVLMYQFCMLRQVASCWMGLMTKDIPLYRTHNIVPEHIFGKSGGAHQNLRKAIDLKRSALGCAGVLTPITLRPGPNRQ
jgi:hypothetical protein